MKKNSILALLFLGTLLMATAATAESKDKWSGLCDGDLSLPRRTAVSASPTTVSAQTPTYNELSATAHSALSKQDYIGAHKAFHTMDSLYGISDFEALYYYYSLSHDFVPNDEVEKGLLFRLARNKCCDMRYLDDWAKRQQADTITNRPMNIVEIGDPQFVMCQSLRDMIILGHYFYQVYTMIPYFSWIPHEVAHQWWGNSIFFEYRDHALIESLTEYIKLQYLKNCGRGYEEQIAYYTAMMERAEKKLPISDIHSVESPDESIAIYHAAPYRLTLEDSTSVNTTLQQLYSKYKHTVVSRDTFLQECEILQDWLMSE